MTLALSNAHHTAPINPSHVSNDGSSKSTNRLIMVSDVMDKYFPEILDPHVLTSNITSRLWSNMQQRGISLGDAFAQDKFLSNLSTESNDAFERDFTYSLKNDSEGAKDIIGFLSFWSQDEDSIAQPEQVGTAIVVYGNNAIYNHNQTDIADVVGDVFFNGQDSNRNANAPFVVSADPLANALKYYQIAADGGHAGAAAKVVLVCGMMHAANTQAVAQSDAESSSDSSKRSHNDNRVVHGAKMSYEQAKELAEASFKKATEAAATAAAKALSTAKHNSAVAQAVIIENQAEAAKQAAAAA